MSCKLIPADKAGVARPVVWRTPPGWETTHPDQAGGQPQTAASEPDASAMAARIEQIEREAEQRARQAYQQGFAAGEQSGAQKAAARIEPVYHKLAATVEELAALRRRVRIEAEEDAVRLAVAVARRILHRELAVDPDALLGIVKAAFERIDAREVHRVRVHPEDAALIERHLVKPGSPARMQVVADASLERGSAIFETSRGNVDASISAQLGEIERGFVDLVRRSG
jgi:flagellar assembly protein FliH